MLELDKERYRKIAPKMLEALEKRQFSPHFFDTPTLAAESIIEMISPEDTIGIGGSLTLREDLGIVRALRDNGNMVYDHWEAEGDPVRRLELKRTHRGVDVFLSGINAITSDGILVNLDGGGNRVASLCSGPRRVIAVAGTNKIVESLDLAIHRTRNHAAILNATRLKRKTPCAETGLCNDCASPERICAALVIHFKRPSDINHFTVILVNEEMGY